MYRVKSFETGEILEGPPSLDLIDACKRRAQPAYRDGGGVWQHVPPEQQQREMEAGRDVMPVEIVEVGT